MTTTTTFINTNELPLIHRSLARRAVHIAVHPWVDDVRDLIQVWPAHEISRARSCELRNYASKLDGLSAHDVSTMSMDEREKPRQY